MLCQATAGLTSGEVYTRGSKAVQVMLLWLEVARLARASRAAATPP
jgi:hypothetical protein